ncbi:MAG: hypothetical protein LBF77_10905 [Spirochaetaceae bacterium]|jgi:hypothetical protein|nr:hypothetical protein [Spirochaetaceae bacterium]
MADGFPPPEEAMRFLSRKKIIPTDKWDDLKYGEHSHGFTVAHSCEADILDDIQGLLKKAQEKGEAFGTFRQGMLKLMEDTGWYGGNGHTKDDTKYINWRIKIIFNTNMRTAYAAARYRTQLAAADLRPVWVYKSMLTGKNRRQEHIALHNKAFRYDDPFWNTYYPPNGWECKCIIETQSESGAKNKNRDVLESGPDGTPPALKNADGSAVDWEKFAGTAWNYNGAREALAPDFSKYSNLKNIRMADGKSALRQVIEMYREDMDETKMSLGQFELLVRRMEKKEYSTRGILYQVGNLEGERFEAMSKAGIGDSKIMVSDEQIYHGIVAKNDDQKIPERLYQDLYETVQKPERIYEETKPEHKRQGRAFHFVKDTGDGKKLKVVLLQRLKGLALKIQTIGWSTYEYTDAKYKKIW